MIISCVKSVMFSKSVNTLGIGLSKTVSALFTNVPKCNRSINKNIIHLREISNVVPQKNFSEGSSTEQTLNCNTLGTQMKKRLLRKKKIIGENEEKFLSGFPNVKAMATADEYDLENLLTGLIIQNLYVPKPINTSGKSVPDAVHAVSKYEMNVEQKEIFFFREGTIVMWNVPESENENILKFLKNYQENSYAPTLVHAESEMMTYTYDNSGKRSHLKDGDIYLALDASSLDKYTFSNALSQSVKLGIWEASLDQYVDSIQFVTEDLKAGAKIQMTRGEVLKKQGELLALRHVINLSSDLLDTPDFYWEKEQLENLYQQTCGYFNINKRTRVMNEKINHCVELVELLSSHLSDRHHIRLEWMIIILIVVEVVFEILHFIDRYFEKSVEYNLSSHSNV